VITVEAVFFICSVSFYSLAPRKCLVLISRLTLETLFATSKGSAVIAVYSVVTRQSSFGTREYSSAFAVVRVGTYFVFTSPQFAIIVSFCFRSSLVVFNCFDSVFLVTYS